MIQRIVVLPDIHVPNHERQALNPIFSFIKFYKPNVLIQLGDFCDWDSVSSYDPNREEEIHPIDVEIRAANELLDEIDSIVPKKTRKIMIGGNHEARYQHFRTNHGMLVGIRRMKSLSSWQEEYGLKHRCWESYEYGSSVTIGKIIFTHGWYASSGAAKAMAECFPGRNVIFGHTHQHLIYGCMDSEQLPIESESIGTLSKFDLSYLKGKPPKNWINSFMYIDMFKDGTFTKHYVRVIKGSFVEYGRVFK